jgi:hypothetical protein
LVRRSLRQQMLPLVPPTRIYCYTWVFERLSWFLVIDEFPRTEPRSGN